MNLLQIIFARLQSLCFFVAESLEKRLRLILDDLLGPSHTSTSKSVWDPIVLVIIVYTHR